MSTEAWIVLLPTVAALTAYCAWLHHRVESLTDANATLAKQNAALDAEAGNLFDCLDTARSDAQRLAHQRDRAYENERRAWLAAKQHDTAHACLPHVGHATSTTGEAPIYDGLRGAS